MKIHHLRNATFIIESEDRFILVDPMLDQKGSALPLSWFRFKALRNPLLDLPQNAEALLAKVTHCLVTHLHPDHLDKKGISFLRDKNIPVVCSSVDQRKLEKMGLQIDIALDYNEEKSFLGGKIKGVRAIHGYGFVTKIAGEVMGFCLELKEGKSIYISSDTVYTEEVHETLMVNKPNVTVLAAGMAQLDIGKLLLMDREDILKFVKNSPGRVYANHMEALNHCPNKRSDLRALLKEHALLEKVDIPMEGDSITY